MGPHAVILRYFNCRGRCQALRYFLVDCGIAFVDERFEVDLSWPTFKDAARGGLFGTPFFGGVEPEAADHFVFEAVDAWLALLGARFVAAPATCPRLREHHNAVLARPNLDAYLASGVRPSALTASPHEPEIRERLSRALTSEEGEPGAA